MHNLPLKPITDIVPKYLDIASPNYSQELADEIKYRGLNSVILYNNDRVKIHGIAEITPQRQIVVFENFTAFLWCVSFNLTSLSNYIRENLEFNADENLRNSIRLLKYGFSLKDNWAAWPNDLPNPMMEENQLVREANSITIIAMNYIIAHEIGHHVLGHDLSGMETGENAKQEEFASDKYAFDVLIAGRIEGQERLNHSINTAIIIGLGSILLFENSWKGDDKYPDSDVRLEKILQHLVDANNGDQDYWKLGKYILLIWDIVNSNNEDMPEIDWKSPKEDFLKAAAHLKKRQKKH